MWLINEAIHQSISFFHLGPSVQHPEMPIVQVCVKEEGFQLGRFGHGRIYVVESNHKKQRDKIS